MKHNYLIGFLLVLFMSMAVPASAQTSSFPSVNPEKPIEGLSIYPNPVTGNKVYITSQKNSVKEIEVYNVLGKKVLSSRITGKELDVTELTPGIYILKIKEGNNQATRKLVVK
ncbi:MAG: T9SS type A sorting domain-containing protein [Gillisia sp.]